MNVLVKPGAAVLGALLCLLLVGCVGGTRPSVSPSVGVGGVYAAEFADIRDESDSDFVRSVVADGVITKAEFEESLNSRFKCMTDAGLSPIIDGEGDSRSVGLPVGEDSSAESEACWEKWDAGIEGLYARVQSNPENIAWEDLVAACLIHEGLVPEGTTGEDFAELQDRAGTKVQMLEDGEFVTLRPPIDPDPAFPNGFRPMSDDAHGCMLDPRATLLGSGGQLPTKQPTTGQDNQ